MGSFVRVDRTCNLLSIRGLQSAGSRYSALCSKSRTKHTIILTSSQIRTNSLAKFLEGCFISSSKLR